MCILTIITHFGPQATKFRNSAVSLRPLTYHADASAITKLYPALNAETVAFDHFFQKTHENVFIPCSV